MVHSAGGAGARPLEAGRREAEAAFGNAEVFLERFVERARHIEVQVLADRHGNLVHLFERDCSVQRRHQKVVEIAPARNLDPAVRRRICDAAVADRPGGRLRQRRARSSSWWTPTRASSTSSRSTRASRWSTPSPRWSPGSTSCKSQILDRPGVPLSDPRDRPAAAGARSRRAARHPVPHHHRGPGEQLHPRLRAHHRLPLGQRLRHPAGRRHGFAGAVITPFYDSLLVKVTRLGAAVHEACPAMERALREFRIRGVKTNIPSSETLITHRSFLAGDYTTRFIDETPELFHFRPRRDRATRLLSYIADVLVNGNPEAVDRPVPIAHAGPSDPRGGAAARAQPTGTRDRLRELGPAGFATWMRDAEAAARHRHHLPRRAPVAARHAHAHVRHAPDRRRVLRPPACPACSRWRCGAGPPSTWRCAS